MSDGGWTGMQLVKRLGAVMMVAGLTACTQFPEIDNSQTPGLQDAPYPTLVPIETLLQGPEPRATPDLTAGIQDRVAGLRGRAGRLQNRAARSQRDLQTRLARLRQRAETLRAR